MLAIGTGFVVLVPIVVALIERRPEESRDWWWIFAKQLANSLGLILLMIGGSYVAWCATETGDTLTTTSAFISSIGGTAGLFSWVHRVFQEAFGGVTKYGGASLVGGLGLITSTIINSEKLCNATFSLPGIGLALVAAVPVVLMTVGSTWEEHEKTKAAALAAKAVAGDNPEGRLMQDAVGVDNGLTGRTA